MSSKTTDLALPESVPWGEDVHTEISRRRASGVPAHSLSEKAVASYLLQIRERVASDPEVARSMAGAAEPMDAHGALCSLMADLSVPGTGDLFEAAVQVLLEELAEQRKRPPSLYLVDRSTGRAVVPLAQEAVYQPPDYVGEDGLAHKARPVVHPGLASGLAMASVEATRASELAALAKDPVSGPAYRHLADPEQMAAGARALLEARGIRMSEPGEGWRESAVEFGRENLEAAMQSVNPRHHRVVSYAAVLARRVADLCGPGGSAWIGPVSLRRDGRDRWYDAVVRTLQAGPSS